MRFLRFSVLAVIISVFAAQAFAQQSTCTLNQAPEMRGFRLGMTLIDARRSLDDPTLFDSKVSAGGSDESRTIRLLGSELKGESGEGVDDINLTFINNKLAVIKLTYNSAVSWEGSKDFFARVSESLGLPAPSGSDSSGAGRGRSEKYKIECTGFTVVLAYSFGISPNVTISDTAAQKLVDKRQEGDKEIRDIRIGPATRRRRP